jgi:hypothetical protein
MYELPKGGVMSAYSWWKRQKEKQKEKKAKKPWIPPEKYYGEDEYKNILFFTQGKEAVERYEAEKRLKEFEQKIREREVIND